ncbi:MAG: hypothetical protein R3E79_36210 [Caldilineaceae bacterium]
MRLRRLPPAQQRGEQRMERMESAITSLTTAQQITEQRMERMESAITSLTTAQQITEQRLGELATAQRRTEQNVERIDNTLKGMQRELRSVRGTALEQKYTQHAAGYFGKWIRRIQVILPNGMTPAFEDLLYNQLTHEEVQEILRLDIILKGNLHRPSRDPEIYLALEVSVTIEDHDIQRAQARSALLRKAGLPAIPVVAGERLDEQADDLARSTPIVVVQNGRSWGWDETVAAYTETKS